MSSLIHFFQKDPEANALVAAGVTGCDFHDDLAGTGSTIVIIFSYGSLSDMWDR